MLVYIIHDMFTMIILPVYIKWLCKILLITIDYMAACKWKWLNILHFANLVKNNVENILDVILYIYF